MTGSPQPQAPASRRAKALLRLGAHKPGSARTILHDFMVMKKWIRMDQCVEMCPVEHIPGSEDEWRVLADGIQRFELDMRQV